MFEEDLKFGVIGEDIVFNHLRHSPKIKHILDVTKAKKYQEDDVDFIVQTIDEETYLVEVKADRQSHETGHLAYELWSNSNKGCLARSKADYVYYVTMDKTYCFKLNTLREYINQIKPPITIMGDNAKGHLLDIEDLIRKGIITEIDKGIMGRT